MIMGKYDWGKDKAIEEKKIYRPRFVDGKYMTKQRINITIHKIEIKRLDEIRKEYNESRSGMITRLIQNFKT